MSDPIHRLKRQLLADKKKFGLMLGLLAVGLLLWGRLLLKDVPRTATAEPKATAVSDSAVSDDGSLVATPAPEPEPAVTVVVEMPRTLTRDMFALDTSGYRALKKAEEAPVRPKPEPDAPDKAYRVAKATEAARGLVLEGIVQGEEPSVIVNGRLLQKGQVIEGLTVYRIEDRRVVLEMDGVYIRLGM